MSNLLRFVLTLLLASTPLTAFAQTALGLADHPDLGKDADGAEVEEPKPIGQIYGFVMADAIFQGGRIDPDWSDAMRPSKLPSFDGEFGLDGNSAFSVRQTRFGVRSWLPVGVRRVRSLNLSTWSRRRSG